MSHPRKAFEKALDRTASHSLQRLERQIDAMQRLGKQMEAELLKASHIAIKVEEDYEKAAGSAWAAWTSYTAYIEGTGYKLDALIEDIERLKAQIRRDL
jgi:hypothetical protein